MFLTREDRRACASGPAGRSRGKDSRVLLAVAGLACLGAPPAAGDPPGGGRPPHELLVPGSGLPGLASRCADESESGAYLAFADAGPGVVSIRLRGAVGADYPGFAIEPAAGLRHLRFVVTGFPGAGRRLAPEVLRPAEGVLRWERLRVELQGGEPWFAVTLDGTRQVIRLWAPEDADPALDRRSPGVDAESATGGGGLAASCAEACYSPGRFCYDYERLKCYLESLAGEPHVTVSVLGWTKPCPGEKDHRPREIFKVRITDERVPLASKERVVLTARVHGGERLTSFVAEGVIDYAIGRSVEPEGAGFLPDLPPRPGDLLERFDIIVYPMLNPDGSADLDGDGGHNYNRYKCGIDLNRRWGTAAEKSEAHEVHLVHQDLIAEAAAKPFAFHRDFHDWSQGYQGGFRHGPGTYLDEHGEPAFTVTEEYVAREAEYFAVEGRLIPYRAGNYTINSPTNAPVAGMARFALYREYAALGLLTNTSEFSLVLSGGEAVSDPPFAGGGDLRHEGAWFLLGLHQALAIPPESAELVRGDVNGNGTIDLSDALKLLFYLFAGATIKCELVADVDANFLLNVTDAVYLLDFQFSDGPPPPPLGDVDPTSGGPPCGE